MFTMPSADYIQTADRSKFAERDYSSNARKAVIVLGMHRSGTSALTRVLGYCGAALPSCDYLDAHESNPLGHWEPRRIVEAHDRFLADAGLGWDEIFDYSRHLFNSRLAETYRSRLTEIAKREYGDSGLFVLKDPRLSRLMPLWRPVLNALDSAPHAVIAVRNPLEVAASLLRRDGWDEYRALVVWMRYMLSAERDTRDMPRCFVRHEALVCDWRPVVNAIAGQLALPLQVDDARIQRDVDSFVRGDLMHHRRRDADLFERGDIPDCVKQVYRCCRAAAEGEPVNTATFDAIGEALAEAAHFYRAPELRRVWGESGPDIAAARRLKSRRDALAALTMAELGSARYRAERSQRELSRVVNSWSWRCTRPLRGACYLIRRATQKLGALFSPPAGIA